MKSWIPVVALIALFALFQIAGIAIEGWPLNFQPLLAMGFCAMACLGGRQWWIVLAAWLLTWPLLSWYQGYSINLAFLGTALGFASVFGIGFIMRKGKSLFSILGGVTLSAISFYLITNTFSFFQLTHLYPRTLEGFIQAQWTGPVGFGPTWVFLRNSIGGNLFFTGLFLASQHFSPATQEDEESEEELEDDVEPAEA